MRTDLTISGDIIKPFNPTDELIVCHMQSPPMVFWGKVSNGQWNDMSDEEQDALIEAAKVLLKRNII